MVENTVPTFNENVKYYGFFFIKRLITGFEYTILYLIIHKKNQRL